jgi:hypothetical protein
MKYSLMVIVLISLVVSVGLWHGHVSVGDHSKSHSVPLYGLDYTAAWLEELKKESAAMNKSPVDILTLRWNAREITVDCVQRPLVQAFVGRITAEGRDLLTEEQMNRLQDSITDFVFFNATNDRRSYYAKLLGQGETINELGRKWISQAAVDSGTLERLDMDPLEQLAGLTQAKCGWRGLVAEGTRIKIYSTRSANLEEPGCTLWEALHRKTMRPKMTDPPIVFKEAVKTRGQVLVADLELFVANNKKQVIPYFCRYWFDDASSIWRLDLVMSRPIELMSHGVTMA